MQQTLLSLVALLVATILTYNQMQARTLSQHQTYGMEMEQMALGVGMETMEVIRARAFDEATITLPSDSTLPKSEFTSGPFPSGKSCQVFGGTDVCSDVDDFHEMVPATVPFPLPGDPFNFTVEVRVRYVDANLNPTGGTTSYRKEVTVYVQDKPEGGSPRLPAPIEYSEVISYP